MSLTDLIAFLYVAENPGISFAELAHVSSINKMTISRVVRRLSDNEAERAGEVRSEPLVRVEPNAADDRSLVVFLTPAGRTLCKDVDQAIAHAIPISPPAEGAGVKNS